MMARRTERSEETTRNGTAGSRITSAVCCALVMAVAAFAGAVAAPTFLHWNAERASLDCARKSEGTDMAIAECYWQHGLPTPEDI